MSRELNRDLFQKSVGQNAHVPEQEVAVATKEDFRVLGFQLESVIKKMKEFESRTLKTESRLQELVGSSKIRFERIQGHFQRQSEQIQGQFNDMHMKSAQLSSRVNESRMGETRMQEMVDRHQQMVQSFEARLQQMQKMMTEQELQLSASRSELKDALKEIARLRRL